MSSHGERHRAGRGGWLRAAILGADDGVVSTASLMIGVAAASSEKHAVLVAGIAGLVAGALSMAAGEYVSVSSQRDAEQADIELEKRELATDPKGELEELVAIYRARGLDEELARKVATQLSTRQKLETHMRDELGLEEKMLARPFQAALVSAASFATLAAVPIVTLLVVPSRILIPALAIVSLASLGLLGALGGRLGGAPMGKAAMRVLLGGGAAMAISALVGRVLGVAGL
ncbi:MAG: VIT1/CCC1 transporter family protein [Polyangiales bacterium]